MHALGHDGKGVETHLTMLVAAKYQQHSRHSDGSRVVCTCMLQNHDVLRSTLVSHAHKPYP